VAEDDEPFDPEEAPGGKLPMMVNEILKRVIESPEDL